MGAVDRLGGVSIGCVEKAVEAASMRLDLRTGPRRCSRSQPNEACEMVNARPVFSCIVLHFYEPCEWPAKAASRYAQRVTPSDALRMLCAV